MNNTNFLVTTDEETSKKLQELGFQLISFGNNQWTFINNGKVTFDDTSKMKCIYTDILRF